MCSILGICGPGASLEDFNEALKKTTSRGPDDSRIIDTGNGYLGFNRLSIMGLTQSGMQPFAYGSKTTLDSSQGLKMPEGSEILAVCNGEIYGFRKMKEDLLEKGYSFISDSDCEILPALYKEYGTRMFRMLDAEYALIFYDAENGSYIAARDPIGIRPLYYCILSDGTYMFASEPKNLTSTGRKIFPFPPGHYFKDGKFVKYRDMSEVVPERTSVHDIVLQTHKTKDPGCRYEKESAAGRGDEGISGKKAAADELDDITSHIHDLLIEGVRKRLDSDTPVGFLLSGGLDSSLVCGIAAKLMDRPLQTWAIGMDIDAIDLKYAREVADYIHSDHHEVIITKKDVFHNTPFNYYNITPVLNPNGSPIIIDMIAIQLFCLINIFLI